MVFVQLWGGPVCCRAAGIPCISMDDISMGEAENRQLGEYGQNRDPGRVAGGICPPVFADYGVPGK